MSENEDKKPVESSSRDAGDLDNVFGDAEPWDPVETKLVVGSLIAAVFFLAVFGFLINRFILSDKSDKALEQKDRTEIVEPSGEGAVSSQEDQ